MRRWIRSAVWLLLCCAALAAQATPISNTPSIRFTGQYNYVATGGSLRNSASNACTLDTTRSQALTGIPAGSTIIAAYLYWGGSGTAVDSNVSLNGATIAASRTFTTTTVIAGYSNFNFFGGFADVTSRITGNGTLTFGGLTVDNTGDYCNSAAVTAGWSVIVIYGSTAEPLRAINIFDGLDWFRGSALPLSVSGFRIPSSGIDGKMTVVTWEGDPANSDALNGFSESLSFNGFALDDGIVPAGSVPSVQQYDGTINTLGLDNTYGVDVDTYNVSPYLSAGQTTASTNYSAGGDLVLLTAQVVSVTSEPVVDLSISKTHTGNFSVGSNGVFMLRVANGNSAGVISVDYPITVTDVLPTGFTYISAVGTGWNCSAAAQTVTCINNNNLTPGGILPDITLTVAVTNAAFPSGNTAQNVSVNNTASVAAAGTVDIVAGNNSATDSVSVLGSNLSASTKTVSDLNGGEADAGDTLRYTITLINNTAIAATGINVTDHVPGNVTGFSVVSLPSGALNSSTGTGTGNNGTGYLNIGNINVPANGSVTVVFNVVVANGISPGATIDNTASIVNPAGTGATPSALQIVVSPSLIAGSGTKQLYLWSNPIQLYRSRPTGTHTPVTVSGGGASSWAITPALQKAIALRGGSGPTGNFPVYLLLANSGSSTGSTRNITVTLYNGATVLASASQTIAATTTVTLRTFTLNLPANVTVNAGSTLTLTVSNSAASGRSIVVTPYSGATYSRVELNSLTVINVDSVQTFTAAYPGSVVASSFVRGNTAYIRAVISDPFGSFDISSATLLLTNPAGTVMVNGSAMTQVNDSGQALKTYEYAYAIPANASAGIWTARVTANEGVEGVTDQGVGTFTVTLPMPALQVTKVSTVVWDPVNLSTNPKRIPGSIISYTITVSNSGPGSVDASTLIMTDAVPANTSLCISNVGQCTAIQFADGSPVSGLSYSSGNTTYSNILGGGAPFSYVPTADANGIDASVTGIRIAPSGSLSPASGGGNPGFSIRFRVKVN